MKGLKSEMRIPEGSGSLLVECSMWPSFTPFLFHAGLGELLLAVL